jgi:hypothetical protein
MGMNHSVCSPYIWELTLGSGTFGAWNLSQGRDGVGDDDVKNVVVDVR